MILLWKVAEDLSGKKLVENAILKRRIKSVMLWLWIKIGKKWKKVFPFYKNIFAHDESVQKKVWFYVASLKLSSSIIFWGGFIFPGALLIRKYLRIYFMPIGLTLRRWSCGSLRNDNPGRTRIWEDWYCMCEAWPRGQSSQCTHNNIVINCKSQRRIEVPTDLIEVPADVTRLWLVPQMRIVYLREVEPTISVTVPQLRVRMHIHLSLWS